MSSNRPMTQSLNSKEKGRPVSRPQFLCNPNYIIIFALST
jgi:hypothetical protein